MIKLDFNSKVVMARVDQILDLLKSEPMTIKEIAAKMGLASPHIRIYVAHLRDSKAIVKHSFKSRAIAYIPTGDYFPPEDLLGIPWEKRAGHIKPFRDAWTTAFFGEAKNESRT